MWNEVLRNCAFNVHSFAQEGKRGEGKRRGEFIRPVRLFRQAAGQQWQKKWQQ